MHRPTRLPHSRARVATHARRLVAAALAAAGLGAAAPAAHATIWTAVPSGTSETITALSYRPGKTVFGTANGKIFTLAGGQRANFAGLSVIDLKVSPNGATALAVLTGGKVVRSIDGGTTWGAPVQLKTYNNSEDYCPTDPAASVGLTNLTDNPTAVAFASDGVAYLTSNKRGSILRSMDGGATWTEVSRRPNATCVFDPGGQNPVDDVAPVVGTDTVFFTTQTFGAVWGSTDGLLSSPASLGNSVNCSARKPSLAVDDASSNRLASADLCAGRLSMQWSDDSGTSFNEMTVKPDDRQVNGEADVAFTGGTALWAGNGGDIYTSNDGKSVYLQPADGVNTTRDWKAVSAYSAANAAVAGIGGALVVTGTANVIPDTIAPTATIADPGTVVAGVPHVFSAAIADDPGGTGIDPASIVWSAPGLTAAGGNPVTLTFGASTYVTLTVSFKDLAGNAGTATYGVYVSPAPSQAPAPPAIVITPGGKSTGTLPGAAFTLQGPKACVASGAAFDATMSMRRITIKHNTIVKLTSVTFYVDGKKAKTDEKAPFKQKLKVPASAAGTLHTLKAIGKIKVTSGKARAKTQTVKFQTCA